MHEALQITQQARVAVVAMFTAAAEEGWTVRQAVEASRAYLAHKGLPYVPDPIAFATNGRQAIGDADMDSLVAIKPSGEVLG